MIVSLRHKGRDHMLGNLTGWHALIILAIVILLFGATKLPALARSVGQSMKIFKNEVKSSDDDEKKSVKSEDSTNDTPSNPKP
jgi:sec-independent protein translocase protein TatA